MKRLAILIVFFIVNYAHAQVANDECSGATVIVPSSACSTITGSLLNATTSSTTNSCYSYNDVFYKFVAAASSVTIKVVGSTGLDVVVGLYNSCNTSSISCTDYTSSGGTEIVNASSLIVGNTYFISIQSFSLSLPSTPNFTLCVVNNIPPSNDLCSDAQLLVPSVTCAPVSGSLLNASTTAQYNGCYGNSDVYYKFVATAVTASIKATASAGLDLVVSLFNTCNAATSLYCADIYLSGGSETINATGLNVGSTYYIKVQGYSSTLPTTFTFTICVVSTNVVPPVNDECSGAIELIPSLSCAPVSGTLQNATTSSITGSCSGNSDVFYKFKATAATADIYVTSSAGLDAVVGVYNACGTSSIICRDLVYSGGTELVSLTGLVIGNIYYVKVQAYGSNLPTTFTFTICVQGANTIVPSNDDCSDPIMLFPSTSCIPVSGTLFNATNSSIANTCAGNNDVFYIFEATAAAATISVAPSASLDVTVGVFESCTGANLNCTDDEAVGTAENVSLTDLIIGNTYIINVQNASSTLPAVANFSICIISANPPPPINDECADAITIIPATAYTPITGTVKSATTSTSTPSCIGNSDVFYKFTATAKTATITVVGSSGLDPVIGIFNACGTSNMDCVDFNYNVGGTEILTPKNLTIGAIYYIKVQDYSTTLPTTFTFTVAVQSAAISTDVSTSESLQQISLFPNPAQNVLNIEHIQTETAIEFVDVRGTVLFQKNISSDQQIDLSECAPGIYILKLSVNGVVENRRVVVSR